MKTIKDDLWKIHKSNKYIIIPTNGNIKNNGEAVMGAGLALQAKIRIPQLPLMLAKLIKQNGNIPHIFKTFNIITFPTKNNWIENADIKLIEENAKLLKQYLDTEKNIQLPIYTPKLGCGLGNLTWEQVEPILKKYLNEYLIIVTLP